MINGPGHLISPHPIELCQEIFYRHEVHWAGARAVEFAKFLQFNAFFLYVVVVELEIVGYAYDVVSNVERYFCI